MPLKLEPHFALPRILSVPKPAATNSAMRFAIVAVACIASDLLIPAPIGLAISAALYLIFSLHLAFRESQVSLLRLDPIVCYQLWQGVVLGIAPFYVAFAYGADSPVPLGRWSVPVDRISYGHTIMVAGGWAFYVGMKHFQPQTGFRTRHEVRAPSTAVLAIGAATGAVFLTARESIASFIGSATAAISFLPLAVLSMVAVNPPRPLKRSENAQLFTVLLGCGFLMLLNTIRDSKMELMFSFFPLVLWLLQRRKLGLLLVAGPAMVLGYLLVIAPLVSAMRDYNLHTFSETSSTIDAGGGTSYVAKNLIERFRSDPTSYLSMWANATMLRLCDPTAAGAVSMLADGGGFLNGRGLDYIPVNLVPRAIWWNKPTLDRGRQFTVALGMSSDDSLATTSTGETAAGELYWNFGWPGVIAGMYLLGATLSFFWWRPVGPDPRRGLIEMTAYLSVTLSFILGVGAAAGPLFLRSIAVGIILRFCMWVRKEVFPDGQTRSGSHRTTYTDVKIVNRTFRAAAAAGMSQYRTGL